MRRLLCYGDSNTYGYDPRSCAGDRYPLSVRWTGRLGAAYEVINAGRNGRMIPRRSAEYEEIRGLLRRTGPALFLVMLGTNDLLNFTGAEEAANRMRQFWEVVLPELGEARPLLVAPPPMCPGEWTADPELIGQSVRYAALCGALAKELGIAFADAGRWEVGLTFDGVHFSEAGHRTFAEGLLKWNELG